MYTTEDITSIAEFARLVAKEALKKEPPDTEGKQTLMTFVRQLEAIRYNPLIFRSILERYEVDYSLLEEPLHKVALHINDAGILSKTLVQWRCTNRV